jgi:hypothetical protein
MKNLPKRIYLQIDADGETPEDFKDLSGVSWCADKIYDNDIAYVLESEDSLDAIAFVEWMRAYEYFDTITKDGKSVDIWVADNCRPHPQYTTAELYQIFKSQS